MKLPANLKQLLQLRGPNPPPPPPLPTLNAILKSTLLDAKHKNVETAWLVLTVRHRGILGFILCTVAHQERRLALC